MSKLTEMCNEILSWEHDYGIHDMNGRAYQLARAAKIMEDALLKCNRAHSNTQAWVISATAIAEVEKILGDDHGTEP